MGVGKNAPQGRVIPFQLCPWSDSNRHWKDFKSSASAIGLQGRLRLLSVNDILSAHVSEAKLSQVY